MLLIPDIAENGPAFRRKGTGLSTKRHRLIDEKAPAYRRRSVGLSTKGRQHYIEKPTLYRFIKNILTILTNFSLKTGVFSQPHFVN